MSAIADMINPASRVLLSSPARSWPHCRRERRFNWSHEFRAYSYSPAIFELLRPPDILNTPRRDFERVFKHSRRNPCCQMKHAIPRYASFKCASVPRTYR
jgi:hypothetical protein